jgi:hypothetical protein
MSDAFQQELAFLGVVSSPAFVRAPEGNGCAERFIRTVKENLLSVRTFDTVEDLRQGVAKCLVVQLAAPGMSANAPLIRSPRQHEPAS